MTLFGFQFQQFYTAVALLTLIALTQVGVPKKGVGPAMGTLILALVWPLIIPVLAYFAFKKYVLKRGPSRNPVLFELEISACLLAGGVAFGVLVWTRPEWVLVQ